MRRPGADYGSPARVSTAQDGEGRVGPEEVVIDRRAAPGRRSVGERARYPWIGGRWAGRGPRSGRGGAEPSRLAGREEQGCAVRARERGVMTSEGTHRFVAAK